MYFRLLPHVFLVKGKTNSLVQDTLNQKSYLVDNELSLLIEKCERNKPFSQIHMEKLKLLMKMKLGKITNQPIFVDKLRLDNSAYKMYYPNMLNIKSAILQITSVCRLDCNMCSKVMCPTCIRSCTPNAQISFKDWVYIIDTLKQFNCEEVILTGGDVSSYDNLRQLVSYSLERGFRTTVNVHQSVSNLNISKSANLNVSIFNNSSLNNVLSQFKDFHHVTLTYFVPVKMENIHLPKNFSVQFKTPYQYTVNQSDMPCPDIYLFYTKMHRNHCLPGRIAIQSNANVYPCLGAMSKQLAPVGNILTDDLSTLICELIVKYWTYSVNDKRICNSCEFRYSCPNCILEQKRVN